jgi:hypothetical protein
MSELARPAREGMRVRVTLDLPIVARREISMSPPTSPQHPVLLRISTSTSIIAVVVAMVVIAAWWSGRIVFASVTSGYVPMTLSVALSVLLLSGAILMRTRLAVGCPWLWQYW